MRPSLYKSAIVSLILMLLPGIALATRVSPTSYDMRNGTAWALSYWDDNYSGQGRKTISGSALSGGLGDLTDGIVAQNNWYLAEYYENHPYVGWSFNPTITFHFEKAVAFSKMKIHFDDSDIYGVAAPKGVKVNGVYNPVTDPEGKKPFWADFNLSAYGLTNKLVVTLERSSWWVFASEFEFETEEPEDNGQPAPAPVPEPSTLILLGSGLLGLGWSARRRRRS